MRSSQPTTTVLLASLALLFTVPVAHAVTSEGNFIYESRGLMGTRFQIVALVDGVDELDAIEDAFDKVEGLEALWSPWIEGSDVARINARAGHEPVRVERRTLELIQRSTAACEASARSFDPTFFALSPLYDFRQEPFKPPGAAQVRAKLPLVDCRRIEINAEASTVRLAAPGMRLHLGGNAKGTALDEAAAVLRAAGVERFVVDGGGDLVAQGEGPRGPWRVGMQNPRGEDGDLIGVIGTTAGAVATSGDYERFAIVDGTRYHHIVDPRTGRPATGCMSVTVFVPASAHAGEQADGLATSLCVLGPDAGFKVLGTVPGAEAALITPDGALHRTSGFSGSVMSPLAPRLGAAAEPVALSEAP